MWRVALATCLSYQYQRSRSSADSATKNIGIPLARASSITGGRSKLMLAVNSSPSSVRSKRNCLISALSARAPSAASASIEHASARQSQRSRALFEHRVEKPVVITFQIVPDGMAVFPGMGQQMPGGGSQKRLFVVRKKRLHLCLAFGPENGASAVHQPTARAQQSPERREQPSLSLRELRDVRRAAQPAHVGMAAHDARRSARCIEQDAIERHPVPPQRRLRRIG